MNWKSKQLTSTINNPRRSTTLQIPLKKSITPKVPNPRFYKVPRISPCNCSIRRCLQWFRKITPHETFDFCFTPLYMDGKRNTPNHDYCDSLTFWKVAGRLPMAKSVKNITPLTLAVLKPPKTVKIFDHHMMPKLIFHEYPRPLRALRGYKGLLRGNACRVPVIAQPIHDFCEALVKASDNHWGTGTPASCATASHMKLH